VDQGEDGGIGVAGIYISNMKLPPEGCRVIIAVDGAGNAYRMRIFGSYAYEQSRTRKAIPVPDHGRLIDADKLDTRDRGNNSQRIMWSNIRQIIADADTIIPSDKEEMEVNA
jgi:hypothetical protein